MYCGVVLRGPLEEKMQARADNGLKKSEVIRWALSEFFKKEEGCP